MTENKQKRCVVGEWTVVSEDGKVYFENINTKEQTEVAPQAIVDLEKDPQGWTQVGEVYVHNTTGRRNAQWLKCKDSKGRWFWKNRQSGEKKWQLPALQNTPETESASQVAGADSFPLSPDRSQALHSLPDSSPSKVVLSAFSKEDLEAQLGLLATERNIEAQLRRKQEEKNVDLHRVVMQQQERINKLEMRTASPQRAATESPRLQDEGASAFAPLPPMQPLPQNDLTPQQAVHLAQDICDKAGGDLLLADNKADPRDIAQQLLSQFLGRAQAQPAQGFQQSFPQGLQGGVQGQQAFPQGQQGFPMQTAQQVGQGPEQVIQVNVPQGGYGGGGGGGDARELVLNLNVEQRPDGQIVVHPQGGQGQGQVQVQQVNQQVQPVQAPVYASSPVQRQASGREEMLDVNLNVYHDGKGGIVAVEPGTMPKSQDDLSPDVRKAQKTLERKEKKRRKESDKMRTMITELQGHMGEVMNYQVAQYHFQMEQRNTDVNMQEQQFVTQQQQHAELLHAIQNRLEGNAEPMALLAHQYSQTSASREQGQQLGQRSSLSPGMLDTSQQFSQHSSAPGFRNSLSPMQPKPDQRASLTSAPGLYGQQSMPYSQRSSVQEYPSSQAPAHLRSSLSAQQMRNSVGHHQQHHQHQQQQHHPPPQPRSSMVKFVDDGTQHTGVPGMGTPYQGVGGEDDLQYLHRGQHYERSPSPVSVFRQYEMADTFRHLQNLASTRPCQGKEPMMVPLPAELQQAEQARYIDPDVPTPCSSATGPPYEGGRHKQAVSVGSFSAGGSGVGEKRRSIQL